MSCCHKQQWQALREKYSNSHHPSTNYVESKCRFDLTSGDFRQKATRGRETSQGNMEPPESNELDPDRENTRPIDDSLESRRSPQLISSGHGDNAIPVGEGWDDPLGHPEPSSLLAHDPPRALSDDPDGVREEHKVHTDQGNWISAGTLSRGSPPITVQSSSMNDDETDRIKEGHAQEECSSRISDGVMHQREGIEQRICHEKNNDGMFDDRNEYDGPPYEVRELGLREDDKEGHKKDGKQAPGGHEHREKFSHHAAADNDGRKSPTSGLMHSKFFHCEKDNKGCIISIREEEKGSIVRTGTTALSGSMRRANADAKSHEDRKQAESDEFAGEKDSSAEESQKRKREERREHYHTLIAKSFRAIASCYESANQTIRDVENSQRGMLETENEIGEDLVRFGARVREATDLMQKQIVAAFSGTTTGEADLRGAGPQHYAEPSAPATSIARTRNPGEVERQGDESAPPTHSAEEEHDGIGRTMPRGTTTFDGVDEGALPSTLRFTARSKRPKLFEFSGNEVTKSRFFSRSAAPDGSMPVRTPETQTHPAGGNVPPWSSIGQRRREYTVPGFQEDTERLHDGDGDAIGGHRLRRNPAAEEDEAPMGSAEGARDESNGCRDERYSHQGNSLGDDSSAWPRRTKGGVYAQPGRPNVKMHRWVSPRVGGAPAEEDAEQRAPTVGDG